MLNSVSGHDEINFMVGGVVTLLGTVTDERGTYLPKSVRIPEFLPELLVLVFHIVSCEKFIATACKEEDIVDLALGTLHVAAEAHEHVPDDNVTFLIWCILLRLSAYREVSMAFCDPFDGDIPDDLPEVKGSFLDILWIAAIKQLGEYFASAKCNPFHKSVVESCLYLMVNSAPFVESLAPETCHRFFSLVERCGKCVQKRSNHRGAQLLPDLLNILETVLQYQYGSNGTLAYGVMARAKTLQELHKFVARPLTQGAAGEEQTSSVQGKAPGTSGDGSLSPRTEISDVSATPMSEETMAVWRMNVKLHLDPIVRLVEAVLPDLEAKVEKQDIANPEEAKELLPHCVVGLLPPPPVFTTRTLASSELTHRACEHCLVACVGSGPLDPLWDNGDDHPASQGEEEDETEDGDDDDGKVGSASSSKPQHLSKKGEEGAGGSATTTAATAAGVVSPDAGASKQMVNGAGAGAGVAASEDPQPNGRDPGHPTEGAVAGSAAQTPNPQQAAGAHPNVT
mmetsp:Transcript_47521/g.102422  ORF Transcript_47521/g.102422 Transcript_47521/m.102422 type:complete len:511 (+) Transcript_47521:567-2099(+)